MNYISRNEITRKIIHLSSSIYPVLYLIFDKRALVIMITGIILIGIILFDLVRNKFTAINYFFVKNFRRVIRGKETRGTTGSMHFMLGVFLTILILPKYYAVVSLFVLIICDTCASIIGIKYGRIKILSKKTFEGLAAFFVSALLISLLAHKFFHLPLAGLIIASFVASIAELVSREIGFDDNLLIPLTYGIIALLINSSMI